MSNFYELTADVVKRPKSPALRLLAMGVASSLLFLADDATALFNNDY